LFRTGCGLWERRQLDAREPQQRRALLSPRRQRFFAASPPGCDASRRPAPSSVCSSLPIRKAPIVVVRESLQRSDPIADENRSVH